MSRPVRPTSVPEHWKSRDERSVTVAKEGLLEEMLLGGKPDCPCCGRRCDVYSRSIVGVPSQFILLLWAKRGYAWTQVRDMQRNLIAKWQDQPETLKWLTWLLSQSCGEQYMSQHLEFLERTGDPARPRTWSWRVTEKGAHYCVGNSYAPSHLLVSNGVYWGPDSGNRNFRFVKIGEAAVHKKFNLPEFLDKEGA